ncbi:MAG: GMC family oxidoreductase N-terminal domain-containing protein [Bacteroidota bacterium]
MIEEVDYIIVGAGSAGCVLANRLSADKTKQVLLLEAGTGDRHPFIQMPGGYARLHRSTFDWGFQTEPQAQVDDRQLYLPRGKVLGGSSSTNAMAYVRGNRFDYDDWSDAGCVGWSYEDVLPYFLKSEHNEQFVELHGSYHQQGGPLHVSFSRRYCTPLASAFIKACQAIGLPRNDDYNGKHQRGAGFFQFTIKQGVRQSTATAFLKPVLNRSNLHVLKQAHTTQILLAKNRATGVEVQHKKRTLRFRARQEVILCAGAYQSPQLLMLSGIGPQEELSRHRIELRHELPGVGQNLQDHLFYPVTGRTRGKDGLNHHLPAFAQILATGQWLFKKEGPVTIGPLEAVAFLNVKDGSGRVDAQFHFAPIFPGPDYKYDLYDQTSFPSHQDGYCILPSLLRPRSRGYVALSSSNPYAPPLIQPNFLRETADLELLIAAGKEALTVMEHPALADRTLERVYPKHTASDDDWAAHIRKSVETIYHPVGTCKMGQDEMAVVDHELKVHGVEGLRVVDGSVMPTIVSGNTNAPIIMIAEKAADFIVN